MPKVLFDSHWKPICLVYPVVPKVGGESFQGALGGRWMARGRPEDARLSSFAQRVKFLSYLYLFALKCTSTRQKIRIFWNIAITFLTLAQNPFNYSKRFNIILEINEVHNYGNFNYKYMYFLKKCIFLRIFI